MDYRTTAEDIRTMRVRGAGRIARAGASALGDFAREYKGDDLDAFRKEVSEAKKVLLDSRPTAVSLWNGVHSAVRGLSDCTDLGEAKRLIVDNAEAFVKNSNLAVKEIARIGAKRIQDGDVIVTHCNSSAAVGVIVEAHRQGKKFKVYATESRPWRQGIITANQLAEAGVDVTLIIDSAVRSVMMYATKVFVGADTVTSPGALVN